MPHRPIRTLVAATALVLSLLPAVGQAKSVTANSGGNPGQSNGNGGGTNQTPDPIHCADSVVVENAGYRDCVGSIRVNDKDLGGWGREEIRFGPNGGVYAFVGETSAGDSTGNGPFGFFDGGLTGALQLDVARIGTFLLALRAGDEYSLYQFESVGGISAFDFDTLGIGRSGNDSPARLTAAAIYGGSAIPAPAALAQVPEPGTPALLLAGLAAIGLLARRRKV